MLLALIAIVSVGGLAAGCGGPSAAQRAQARAANLDLIAPELKDRLSKQAAALKTACQTEAGDFLNAVSDLDSRLDVGLTYDDYTSAVADAKVAYDRMTPSALHGDCLSAAAADEKAMNAYLKAATIWSNCFDTDYCTNEQIKPQLQSQWAIGTENDDRAKADLAKIAGGASLALGTRDFPTTSYSVDDTIYGTIVKTICADPPDPPAAGRPCRDLRNSLAGGVDATEQNKVDSEINDLIESLGLKTS